MAPIFLITNDDGIRAPGLQVLAETMAQFGDVYVAAPSHEMSGTSHSLTLNRPLRVQNVAERSWSIDGTPADCVLFALRHLVPGPPDWVVAGINRGANLGQDVVYSGTVGAAMEGCLNGVRSVALSQVGIGQEGPEGYQVAAQVTTALFRKLFDDEFNKAIGTKEVAAGTQPLGQSRSFVLNVNVPKVDADNVKGFRVATLGHRYYETTYDKRHDPRGHEYYWIGSGGADHMDIPGSDCSLVQDGYVTVTPLQPDPYAAGITEVLKSHGLEGLHGDSGKS